MSSTESIRGITDNGRYIVVSADTHGGARVADYRAYLPASLHDEFDAWEAEKYADGDRLDPNNYDFDQRRNEQVSDGVVAGIIFPNSDPPFALNVFERGHDRRAVELQWEGLKAHNRWMADHCSSDPDRLRGVLQTSPFLPEESAAEIRWAADNDMMTGGALVRVSPPDGAFPQLYEEHWEPVWAAASEVGVPIQTHGGNEPLYGPGFGKAAIQVVEVGWWTQRGLTQFLLGGILDRFRDLTVVLTEQAVGWVKTSLPQIGWFATQVRLKHDAQGADHLERTPREAFRDQVLFGASFPSGGEVKALGDDAPDQIMWGNDYPHREGSWPYTTEALRVAFSGRDPADVARMVSTNAADLYGFDLDALAPLAAQVGPKVDEVARPLEAEDYPADSYSPAFTLRSLEMMTKA